MTNSVTFPCLVLCTVVRPWRYKRFQWIFSWIGYYGFAWNAYIAVLATKRRDTMMNVELVAVPICIIISALDFLSMDSLNLEQADMPEMEKVKILTEQ